MFEYSPIEFVSKLISADRFDSDFVLVYSGIRSQTKDIFGLVLEKYFEVVVKIVGIYDIAAICIAKSVQNIFGGREGKTVDLVIKKIIWLVHLVLFVIGLQGVSLNGIFVFNMGVVFIFAIFLEYRSPTCNYYKLSLSKIVFRRVFQSRKR